MRGTRLVLGSLLGLILPALAHAEPPAQPAKKYSSAAAARGVNEFAFDLYRQLAKEAKPGENIFFSPYSISAAVAMTYAGARGETAEQIAKVMRFDRDQEQFHPAFAQLSKQIRNPGKDFSGEINIANAIWTSIRVRPEFQRVVDEHHGAGIRPFGNDPIKIINEWVAEQTRQKIKKMLYGSEIDGSTKVVLANAIYIHAKWQAAFDKKQTKDERFYPSPKDAIVIPTMHRTASLRYAKVDNAQIVELPYAGGAFSMVLVLPDRYDKLANVENGLHRWDQWMAALRETEVMLAIPRMKLKQRYTRLAGTTFPAIGLTLPFSEAGNFSGIGSGVLFNIVIHEAVLEADEEGTTAAAATVIGGVMGGRGPAKVVRLNRPFLLALRDRKESTILFLGRVVTPAMK